MMKEKLSFIRIQTMTDRTVKVDFVPRRGDVRTYYLPTDDSLYRILNNSMVSDICPFMERDGLLMEVFPKY